jgi:hypothetical protein
MGGITLVVENVKHFIGYVFSNNVPIGMIESGR